MGLTLGIVQSTTPVNNSNVTILVLNNYCGKTGVYSFVNQGGDTVYVTKLAPGLNNINPGLEINSI